MKQRKMKAQPDVAGNTLSTCAHSKYVVASTDNDNIVLPTKLLSLRDEFNSFFSAGFIDSLITFVCAPRPVRGGVA